MKEMNTNFLFVKNFIRLDFERKRKAKTEHNSELGIKHQLSNCIKKNLLWMTIYSTVLLIKLFSLLIFFSVGFRLFTVYILLSEIFITFI